MFDNLEDNYKTREIFITDDGSKYDYSSFLDFESNFSQALKSRSLVFLLCANNPESIFAYLYFIRNKIVPILLDSKINEELLNNLINQYGPSYIWAPKERSKINGFKKIYSYKNYYLSNTPCKNNINLNQKLAILLTTSGSTGSPKLVKLSYTNLSSNAESIAEYLSIDKNQRPITSLPMNYSFGLSIINSHIIKGSTILLTSNSMMEKGFWEFIKGYQATSLSGVPYTYEMLKRLRFFEMDLPHLQTLTQAGGKLNKNLAIEFGQFCNNKKINFFIMYGQTEATARMSYLPPKELLKKPHSIGLAIPGGKFSLIDEDGEIIDENKKVGELVFRGPNVFMGYAISDKDLSTEANNNNLLHTGDLAERDEDGFYNIVGRKKRFVKIYGNRINLDELEDLIKAVVSDVACAGTDDNLQIYITDKKYMDLVKKYVTKKTGLHFKAFNINIIESIPKNLSGKTSYAEL